MLLLCRWEFFSHGLATGGMAWGYFSGWLLESRLAYFCFVFIFRVRRLGEISSLSFKLQSAAWDVIFGSCIFLRFVDILVLPVMVDCLSRSYSWRVWVGIGSSVFLFKKQTQICNKSRVTLVRCNRVCNWMDVIEKICNESNNVLEWKIFVWILPNLLCNCIIWNGMHTQGINFDSKMFKDWLCVIPK